MAEKRDISGARSYSSSHSRLAPIASHARSRSNKSLSRVFSGYHIDDQSLYHKETRSRSLDSDDDDASSDGDVDITVDSNGIPPAEKDVEAGNLQKRSTSRSKEDPNIIGGGVLSDCWRADERGRSIAIYSLAPLLGPAIGPLCGSFITENASWRWSFYATSIADAFVQLFGLFFLRETYAPTLLHRKAETLRKETDNVALKTEFEHPEHTFASKLRQNLVRPFKMLATQPIIQVLTVYMSFLYGLMYLVLSTFPLLWTGRYHEELGVAGLNYISIGVGFTLGTQVASPLNDRVYRLYRRRNNGEGQPEFRIPLMNVGSCLVPIGLFIYAWTSQSHTHWIGPNIGAAIFSLGMIICYQCIQTYLVDAYTRYAASALAATTVLRSLAGFGFPLFAPYMYNALNFGWGNSLLGFVGVGLGIPAPILLWIYGRKLREKSRYAAGG
ncbi:uncharacterized protein KY384_001072 [Bacidia gigantensis]|uniref:uncharacterized protein n=1 Tax=Bacidia gigantensis TaxID=2732470 RepID=UPI001D05B352|nr:uncharacterized protein KY384_001072 [Bacidia gigantensis]KAG8534228.1 hypothetical protein KY384_001072 [Bacidia gigantensis]